MNYLSALLSCVLVLVGCTAVPQPADQLSKLHDETGFVPVQVDGAQADYLGKVDRGYKLLLRIRGGDVWGRYAIRLGAGELGREAGGIWSYLTGSYRSGVGSIVGSPFDRLLSEMIGQPISVSMFLHHGRATAPRLDIVSQFSTIQPQDPQEKIQFVNLGAGSLYSNDRSYAARVLGNKVLMQRVKQFRSQYIRVDETNISFIFSGSENEYSGMIRNAGGYSSLIQTIAATLMDLADAL